jgi:hypothetical protein
MLCGILGQCRTPFVRPNPHFVAFRLSALRRPGTMALSPRLLGGALASVLFPSILVPALIGELSFAVWLTVKGVNVAG